MEKIIKIIRISSKEWFYELKAKSPLKCWILDKNFFITSTFYNHISWYKKSRPIREIIERLSLVNLIVKIWKEWELLEQRENQKFEKNSFFKKIYKISLKISKIDFKIVLWEKESWKIILLSCFVGNY